jgi:hypothetical protein
MMRGLGVATGIVASLAITRPLASYIPARRAIRLDRSTALRDA